MVETWDVTIPELTGAETRRAYVYLPKSYKTDSTKRYPVLYMFDGHNVFFDTHATYGKSWGMMEYLDSTKTEIIVAAVECNHSPDHGRLKEYSPFSFSDPKFGKIVGKGRITMEWMSKTFKNMIDSKYRTLSDRKHTMIAGSSMGGLMSLYAVTKYNHVYSRAAALSPSLWTDSANIEWMIRGSAYGKDTIIYMDYGSKELDNHTKMENIFKNTVKALMDRRIFLTSRIVPGGTHCEACWEKQIPLFMNTLLYGLEE